MVGALEGLTVVEYGGQLTNYCGKMFAELGADVILVEPPSGSDLRAEPPFVDGQSGDEALSIQFAYRNTSKRSIVLDMDRTEGRAAFGRIAGQADIVLEGQRPGRLDEMGLGYVALAERNPSLVMTSVTPFGQTGPYAAFEDSDLILMAFGGLLWMGGYADGPPVRAAGDQAYMAGNLFGAVATMIAVTNAELTGEGQHVDVSVQESVVMGLENAAQFYDLEGHVRRRFGGDQREAGFGVFPCRDGHVFLIASGIGGNRFWANLVDWLEEENIEGATALRGAKWGKRDFMASDAAQDEFWDVFTRFSLTRNKQDLYHDSQKWRVPLGPVNKPTDILESAQLRHRGYFVEMEMMGRSVRMPGAPYQLSETPWQLTNPAPRLGEHTDEVLKRFGFTVDERSDLFSSGAVA